MLEGLINYLYSIQVASPAALIKGICSHKQPACIRGLDVLHNVMCMSNCVEEEGCGGWTGGGGVDEERQREIIPQSVKQMSGKVSDRYGQFNGGVRSPIRLIICIIRNCPYY